MALAANTANSTARRFNTGSAPGSPRQVGQTCVFGSPPYWFTQPQKAFDSVSSCTWTSSPITGWYLARTSGERAVAVDIFSLILASRDRRRRGLHLSKQTNNPQSRTLMAFQLLR